MKKLLISATLSLFTILSIAGNHLEFMGIPIDGTMNDFNQSLIKKGFSDKYNDNIKYLDGSFAGEKVTIALSDTPITKTMCSVLVTFSSLPKSQSYLDRRFQEFKEQYTKKYGEPSIDIETVVFWKTENGNIVLNLSRASKDISILYSDANNGALDEKEKKEKVLKDI